MIKSISLAELSRFQKNFFYKKHDHVLENVFLHIPGQEIAGVRAYNLCKLCGQMNPLTIDKSLLEEIKNIVAKKTS